VSNYSVTIPEGEERGIRIRCDDHDEAEEFQPGYRSGPGSQRGTFSQ